MIPIIFFFFFFNDTATTEIYTLSLHDALPISDLVLKVSVMMGSANPAAIVVMERLGAGDRKSTRLNSSHSQISYAVFCLKKKKKRIQIYIPEPDRRRGCTLHAQDTYATVPAAA